MGNSRIVLDYAPPPPSFRRKMMDWLIYVLRYVDWFLRRRKLRVPEIFIVCWTLAAATWVAQWLRFIHDIYPLQPALILTALAALARLVMERRWGAVMLCVMIAIPTAVASGVLQYESCPHATYLQFCGVNIPIVGKACNNLRHNQPWWLKEF